MNSPLATIAKQLRKLKWNKQYWGKASLPQQSEIDHIATSLIYGLITIHWWWAFLGTWLWHCVVVELIVDTWWKRKNERVVDAIDYESNTHYDKDVIDWNSVIAQSIERSVGHLILLPVLIWSMYVH